MSITRRSALKILAGVGAAVASSSLPTSASVSQEPLEAPSEAMGTLYDTTRCIGCKACVFACGEANELEPDRSGVEGELHQAPLSLNARTKNIIKLCKSADGQRTAFVKSQCMHCVDPACVSACMIQALQKDERTGVVTLNLDYCVGCRYCMVACPFGVPSLEFGKALPAIVKCEFCRHRVMEAAAVDEEGFTRYPRGQGPACCEACPSEAVIYGRRDELLREAKRRIAGNPGRYFQNRVYGEVEGGGTQALYLSHVPFSELGLPDLGDRPTSEIAMSVQQGIYRGFAAPVALYAVLAGAMLRARNGSEKREDES